MIAPKVSIVAAANNFHFIDPLIEPLSEWFEIEKVKSHAVQFSGLDKSDLVWLEWADGICLDVLYQSWKSAWKNKIILRLHRYELFTKRTLDYLKHIHYRRIDKLLLVSETVRQIGINKFPWVSNSVVIPNLFDHRKFQLKTKNRGFNILMLGRMSYVKNLPLALSALLELKSIDSRFKLHIVGNISEPELIYYVSNFIDKTSLELDKDVLIHGRIENNLLSEFMNDMNYIMSTSIFESQGMGIIEAMSCGLKPLVFSFPGAETNFPRECLWIDFDQLKQIIASEYNPAKYSEYVYDKFSIEKQIYRYKDLIGKVLNDDKSQPASRKDQT